MKTNVSKHRDDPEPIEDSDDNEPLSEEEEETINGEIGLSYIDIIFVMF